MNYSHFCKKITKKKTFSALTVTEKQNKQKNDYVDGPIHFWLFHSFVNQINRSLWKYSNLQTRGRELMAQELHAALLSLSYGSLTVKQCRSLVLNQAWAKLDLDKIMDKKRFKRSLLGTKPGINPDNTLYICSTSYQETYFVRLNRVKNRVLKLESAPNKN